MSNISGSVICEAPNPAIYKFEGVIKLAGRDISLGAENMVLRGMSLRNTEWIYGVTVFTGHETKIFKNSAPAIPKLSRLEK